MQLDEGDTLCFIGEVRPVHTHDMLVFSLQLRSIARIGTDGKLLVRARDLGLDCIRTDHHHVPDPSLCRKPNRGRLHVILAIDVF